MKTPSLLFLIAGALALGGYFLWSRFHIPDLPIGKSQLTNEQKTEWKPDRNQKKFLLVSCFQSWCGDCIREAPSIQGVQRFAGTDRLEVLMISDEEWSKISRFSQLSKCNLSFYQSEKTFRELGIRVFPSTWLISPDGEILLAKLEGYDWNSDEVRRILKEK
jgi:thiol-disulfide isomerase/thioredoxin